MSSLTANQVKNTYFGFNSTPFIVHTNLYATVQTYATYTTLITTITIRSLLLYNYNLFESHTCSLFFSHENSLFCLQSFCKLYTYSLHFHSDDLQKCNIHTRLIKL